MQPLFHKNIYVRTENAFGIIRACTVHFSAFSTQPSQTEGQTFSHSPYQVALSVFTDELSTQNKFS